MAGAVRAGGGGGIVTHTKGPWRQSNNELGYLTFDILADNLGWPNIGIATTVDARFSDPSLGTVALDRDTCNANARLIAAAPTLLEACQKVYNWLNTDEMVHSLLELPEWEAELRAAIAQAKGLVAHEEVSCDNP